MHNYLALSSSSRDLIAGFCAFTQDDVYTQFTWECEKRAAMKGVVGIFRAMARRKYHNKHRVFLAALQIPPIPQAALSSLGRIRQNALLNIFA